MSESVRNILVIVFSLMQIIGLILTIVALFVKVPSYFRIILGIAGIASIVKYYVCLEPRSLDLVAAFAGIGIILIVVFRPKNLFWKGFRKENHEQRKHV